jgi:hypothetical protein
MQMTINFDPGGEQLHSDLKSVLAKLTALDTAVERTFDERLWAQLLQTSLFAPSGPDADMEADVRGFFLLGHSLVEGPALGTWLARRCGRSDRAVGFIDLASSDVVEWYPECNAVFVLDGATAAIVDKSAISATEIAAPLDPRASSARISIPRGANMGHAPEEAAFYMAAANVLLAAQQVGIARALLALTVEFAKTRVQFGVPIGSFQALKHQIADAASLTVLAQAACLGAGSELNENRLGSQSAALAARLVSDRAAMRACEVSIQVHGAPGFAWQNSPHACLRRALANGRTIDPRSFAGALGTSDAAE